MKTKASGVSEIVVMVALGLVFAGALLAQTTATVNVRHFEVISVDGNKLVVRDERGTNEYTVPDDFRFTVDGKKMSVSELKAGMKGTATVTTTTTIKPVAVTEIREGVVLSAGQWSMIVRDSEGVRKKFTRDQLDQRGVQILKDGRVMSMDQLKKGDTLTATIITQVAPVVVTEQEVEATLAASTAEPAPTKDASAAAPAQPAPAASPAPTPPASPRPTPPASPPPSAAQPASPPAEQSGLGLVWYLVIAILVAVIVFAMRRKKQA
jgi:hypothetical protein